MKISKEWGSSLEEKKLTKKLEKKKKVKKNNPTASNYFINMDVLDIHHVTA